jgi:hypothetical protein
VSYDDGRDILRDILIACTRHDFAVSRVQVEHGSKDQPGGIAGDDSMAEVVSKDASARKVVTVALEVQGTRSIAKLAAKITDIPGVISVNATDVNVLSD